MRPGLRRVLLVTALLASLAWSLRHHHGGQAATARGTDTNVEVLQLGQLKLEPCAIGKSGQGAATMRAFCTAFEVPENRAQPQGRRIRLRVAVLRAAAAEPDADPVVFLDGGPGGAASEDFPAIAGAFEPLRKRHLLLLIDQRGTGGSNALDCGDDHPAAPSTVATAAATAAPQDGLQRVRECIAQLAPRAAPQFYTTSDAVADLEAVRLALGGPRLDLIGVSYGTRVAQQYARRYPEGVRALVLDSAVPNDLALGSEHARNLEDVVRELFARCRLDHDCSARFGDPYQTLQRVRARLRAAPQALELRDPYTFRVQQKTISAEALGELIRLYAYNPYTAALLPYVLQEADAGHYAALLGQTQLVVGDVEDHVNGGMGLSVACAEDADRLAPNPADAQTVLGNGLVERLLSVCGLWPHGSSPADFGQPLSGPVPTLILAGEHDPVTPPRYGRAIARTLPRARLLLVTGQGHGLMGVGCMPRLVGEFIRTLDAAGLDAHCLDVLGQTPSFYDANGAGP